jgi:hypothetical protein
MILYQIYKPLHGHDFFCVFDLHEELMLIFTAPNMAATLFLTCDQAFGMLYVFSLDWSYYTYYADDCQLYISFKAHAYRPDAIWQRDIQL